MDGKKYGIGLIVRCSINLMAYLSRGYKRLRVQGRHIVAKEG